MDAWRRRRYPKHAPPGRRRSYHDLQGTHHTYLLITYGTGDTFHRGHQARWLDNIPDGTSDVSRTADPSSRVERSSKSRSHRLPHLFSRSKTNEDQKTNRTTFRTKKTQKLCRPASSCFCRATAVDDNFSLGYNIFVGGFVVNSSNNLGKKVAVWMFCFYGANELGLDRYRPIQAFNPCYVEPGIFSRFQLPR